MKTTASELVIFGDNEYALGMILETLHKIYQKAMDVQVVINRDFSPQHPYDQGLHRITIVHEDNYVGNEKMLGYLAGMSPTSRKFLWDHYRHRVKGSFPPLIHPSVVLPYHISIGEGVRIEPSVTIAPFVSIGKATLINRGVLIGHHTFIHDYVNINPGAILNGNCIIGSGTTIGSGAIINDKIEIGSNVIIGSGSIVTKNIPDHVIAYGQPAKIIKSIEPT